jgi:signal transduction histidine kinase
MKTVRTYRTTTALLSALLLLCGIHGADPAAQYSDHRNRNIDSLENLLANNPPTGKELVRLYSNLTWGCLRFDLDKTRSYARKGIELAQKGNNHNAASSMYQVLGITCYQVSQYDSALFYYNKALEHAELMRNFKNYKQSDIDDRRSVIYGNIANVYNIQGNNHLAIDYYLLALRIFEKYGWKESQSIAYGNIGELYMAMDNREQAKYNYRKAWEIALQTGDSLIISEAQEGLGKSYFYDGLLDSALYFTEQALHYSDAHIEEATNAAVIRITISRIYLKTSDYERAEKSIREAIVSLAPLDAPRESAEAREVLASVQLRRRQWRDAEQTALDALAADSTDPTQNVQLYEILAKAYAHLGEADKSDEYTGKLKETQATWSSKHYQSSLREMETRYETEKKETQIAALQNEKRQMQRLGVAAGVALLLGLAALFFLWRWTVQKRRLAEQQIRQFEQERQLIATQAMFDGEVKERTRLARDLHDRLGGVLTATKFNLAEMRRFLPQEPASEESFDKTMSLLDESIGEMRRIAHHLMPDSLSRFGLKAAITEFCKSIPHARFSWFGGDERFDTRLELSLYRIAYELVNNALKHSGASVIKVQIVRDPDRIALTVEDNGCGFNVAGGQTGEGMGLSNVRAQVTSFNGVIDVGSAPDEGTEINVEFQLVQNKL